MLFATIQRKHKGVDFLITSRSKVWKMGWSHAEWVGHWDRTGHAGMPRTSVKLSTDRAAPVHNSWNMLWLFVRKHCGRLNGRLPPEYYKKKFLTSQPEKQAIFLLIEFQIWLFMKKQSTIHPLVPTGGGRCSSLDASFAQCFVIFLNIVKKHIVKKLKTSYRKSHR